MSKTFRMPMSISLMCHVQIEQDEDGGMVITSRGMTVSHQSSIYDMVGDLPEPIRKEIAEKALMMASDAFYRAMHKGQETAEAEVTPTPNPFGGSTPPVTA